MTTDSAPHAARPGRPAAARPSRIGPLLLRAHRRAARNFSEALQPLHIEGRHYGVLAQLGSAGPLSQRRLIDLTGADKSSMVRTVDDLEQLGYAVRRPDPADRRAHAVELTDAGRTTLAEADRLADEVGARLLDVFGEEEVDALCGLLQRFIAAEESGT